MKTLRQDTLERCERMSVGQSIFLSGAMFRDAFKPSPFNLNSRTAIDECLNNLVGANYGGFTVGYLMKDDIVVISRHECAKRVRADIDREHLYKKVGNHYENICGTVK